MVLALGRTSLLAIVVPFLLWLLPLSATAVVDVYEFQTPEDEARYEYLIDELRCPKCQNQNLSGSDSQIANDLRRELRRMITEGQSDSEIKDFMVARYGDYVLYRPRLTSKTYALWFGPIALLGLGAFVLILIVRSRGKAQSASVNSSATPMSDEEQQALQSMLDNPIQSNKNERN